MNRALLCVWALCLTWASAVAHMDQGHIYRDMTFAPNNTQGKEDFQSMHGKVPLWPAHTSHLGSWTGTKTCLITLSARRKLQAFALFSSGSGLTKPQRRPAVPLKDLEAADQKAGTCNDKVGSAPIHGPWHIRDM